MKTTLLLTALFLVGCAAQTLEELEAEALRTGDWTKVERREKRDEAKTAFRAAELHCKAQKRILFCHFPPGASARHAKSLQYCGCASREDAMHVIGSGY